MRKDYADIRENMVVLTHQYSRAPSKSFFVTFGILWLAVLAVILIFQPNLTEAATSLMNKLVHRFN